MARVIKSVIKAEDAGRKIGVFVRRMGLSNSALKKLRHTEGAILLNGSAVFSSERLSEGDRLTLLLPEKYEGRVVPEPMDLEILYEDEDFLIVNKPPFLPTHPSKGHPGGTLANAVTAYNLQKGFDCPFRALSRLDAMTSGAVVTARNLAAASAALEGKIYIGVVAGLFDPPSGRIDLPIRRIEEGAPKRGIFEDGLAAATLYETIETFKSASLVRFELLSGRTHQIRVHASHLGHPIIGDGMYGEASPLIARQALHAAGVRVLHPFMDRVIEVQAPLPEDIADLIEKLR